MVSVAAFAQGRPVLAKFTPEALAHDLDERFRRVAFSHRLERPRRADPTQTGARDPQGCDWPDGPWVAGLREEEGGTRDRSPPGFCFRRRALTAAERALEPVVPIRNGGARARLPAHDGARFAARSWSDPAGYRRNSREARGSIFKDCSSSARPRAIPWTCPGSASLACRVPVPGYIDESRRLAGATLSGRASAPVGEERPR